MSDIFNHPDLKKYEESFPAGIRIMTEGDKANDLFILVHGCLEVIKGGKKIHEITEPGAFFGEISFLLGTPRTASIDTACETKALRIPNTDVPAIWSRFPEFADILSRTVAERLHETTNVAHGFRAFCDQMPDAVIMTDENQNVLSWNQAAEKLYGRTWDQMRDKTIDDIYDNQAAFTQFMAELKDKGAISERTLKINHPTKDWCFVSTSTTVLSDPGENVHGFLFLGRDSTNVHDLQQRHRQFKLWLLPLLAVLLVLLGWLGFSVMGDDRSNGQREISLPGGEDKFLERLFRDSSRLDLALIYHLKNNNLLATSDVLNEYFTAFQPEMSGITGLLLLDQDKQVLSNYFSRSVPQPELAGKPYDGTLFADYPFTRKGPAKIYLVSDRGIGKSEGIEIAFPLTGPDDQKTFYLVFHLNMELVAQKYQCDIKDISRALRR